MLADIFSNEVSFICIFYFKSLRLHFELILGVSLLITFEFQLLGRRALCLNKLDCFNAIFFPQFNPEVASSLPAQNQKF